MLRILLTVSMLLPMVPGHADEPTPPPVKAASIHRAIEKIKARAAGHGGFGATFNEVAHIFGEFGFAGFVTGLVFQLAAGPGNRIAKLSFRYAGTLFIVAATGSGVGYLISAVENRETKKATPAEEFKSTEGLEEFLKLSPEEQAAIANEDKTFADYLKKSAKALEDLEPK